MKKIKLLTLGFGLPVLATAMVPAVASCNKPKSVGPTIIEQPNVKVIVTQFELGKDLIMQYSVEKGYYLDQENCEIKFDGKAIKHTLITFNEDDKIATISGKYITTNDISIKFVAAKVGQELIFSYDPETTWFTYDEGETLDFTGIKITEKFESGATKEINIDDCKTTPARDDKLTVDDYEVKIEYHGLTCTYPIFVTKDYTKDMFMSGYAYNFSRYPSAECHWENIRKVYGTYNGKEATDCEMILEGTKELKLIFGTDANYLTMYGGSKYSESGLSTYLSEQEQTHTVNFYRGYGDFLCYKVFDGEELIEEVIFKCDNFIEFYYQKGITTDSGVIVLYDF